MNGMERLAQAERDNVALHKALTDAITRMTEGRARLQAGLPQYALEALVDSDLRQILIDTSHPEDARDYAPNPTERCSACGALPSEDAARASRRLLAHLTTAHREYLMATYSGTVPTVLCATCTIANLSVLNAVPA